MYKIIGLVFVLAVFGFALACGGGSGAVAGPGTSGDSPTEAYKRLYAAVKSKNTDSIKAVMTAKSLEFAEMAASKNSTPIEKVFENGFTATTFAEKMPEIRDQRIKDTFGSVEVYNAKDSRWEDLPFINDNGTWKFAVGDLFAGSFVSPGKGRDFIEKEAANAQGGGPVPAANIPMNANVIVPKAAVNANTKAK